MNNRTLTRWLHTREKRPWLRHCDVNLNTSLAYPAAQRLPFWKQHDDMTNSDELAIV
jgi:hypothetical protein